MPARLVDAIVVGSGHNGLTAAAYLARAGWDVEVIERNPVPGGAVATDELTEPGFLHDTFSGWHALFLLSRTYAELGGELADRGLRYRNTEIPSATLFPDGEAALAYRSPQETAAGFSPEDGPAYLAELEQFQAHSRIVAELLGTELHSVRAALLALRLVRRYGMRRLGHDLAQSARGWLRSNFGGRQPAGLYAPWTLHLGLTPDGAGGAFQLRALAASHHEAGQPVVEGGSGRLVDAFVRLVEDHGGRVRTGSDVEEVLVSGGRAIGVRTGGEELRARRAVIVNVTPTQLYGRLLGPGVAPQDAVVQARRFRYGRGDMQIHLALSEPPRWRDPRLAQAAIVHLTPGLDGVSLACAQADAGLLPGTPTIVCGQPTALDPSRAPEGGAILWLQLLETPYRPVGDAAGELDVAGFWTPELEAAYAQRVLDLLALHVENLRPAVVGTAILSPPELERRNVNLVSGDPYAGATDLDQSYVWRPLPSHGSHRTPIGNLYHCGASTYPGPGLHAASGRIVAQRLLSRRSSLARRCGGKGS